MNRRCEKYQSVFFFLKKVLCLFAFITVPFFSLFSQRINPENIFYNIKEGWLLTGDNIVYKYEPAASEKFAVLTHFYPYKTIVSPAGSIYLVETRYIVNNKFPDSIAAADSIAGLSFVNDVAALAIIKNDSANANFFAKKNKQNWEVSPVLFTDEPQKKSYEAYFWALFILVPMGMIILIARNRIINREIKEEIKKQSVENPLLTKSEKPIGLTDEDLLGFDALENAVLSIIRNPQTELPMSIVISGDWGSGKSSMMNRIREKIETDPATNKRFMTSWFNAWHFQTENRLLDAFLLNIIGSYNRNYSGFFEPFRMRLWLQRFQKQSFSKKLMFGFALAVAVPFLISLIKFLLSAWFPFFSTYKLEVLDSYESILSNLFIKGTFFTAEAIPTVGAGLIAILSAFFLNKQLMTQGLNSLMSFLPKTSSRLEVEKRQAGYREEFKREYWEIIDAGEGTKRLVVFIDDIDRISGEKVLELLEAINFISDVASKAPGSKSRAPNTIFVMGMYAKEVTRNLGTRLNEINKVSNDLKDPQLTGAFYIEKMVQLIVPIPFDGSKLKQLL